MKINTEFIRIALVGAPGAGKTSVMKILKKSVAPSSFEIGFINEAATVLMQDPSIRALRSSDPVAFQEKVSLTQFFQEDGDTLRVLSSGISKYLQITDRAIQDMYVYLNDGQRSAMKLPIPTLEELNRRYDAVICFELYDSGASLKAGNGLRAEKAMSDIRTVYEKSLSVYSRHKNFHPVSPCDRITDKAKRVAELIEETVGERLFLIENDG